VISIVSNLCWPNAMLFPIDLTDEWLSIMNVGLVTDRVSEEGMQSAAFVCLSVSTLSFELCNL